MAWICSAEIGSGKKPWTVLASKNNCFKVDSFNGLVISLFSLWGFNK
jgi:hypothetical protein